MCNSDNMSNFSKYVKSTKLKTDQAVSRPSANIVSADDWMHYLLLIELVGLYPGNNGLYHGSREFEEKNPPELFPR